MGMFDSIIIDSKQLPVSDAIQETLYESGFQTKDLDCELLYYEIKNDGQLFLVDKLIDFTGVLNFYTYGDDGKWYEFNAPFKNGKLLDIYPV